MRCRSVQRRLTSDERRLSTHFACFPERSLRRAVLGCGRLSATLDAAAFSESSLMDFTVHVDLSSTDSLLGPGCSAEMWVQRDYRAIAVKLLEIRQRADCSPD